MLALNVTISSTGTKMEKINWINKLVVYKFFNLSPGYQTTLGDFTKGLPCSNLSIILLVCITLEVLRSYHESRYNK
jgi:hypothetical protein